MVLVKCRRGLFAAFGAEFNGAWACMKFVTNCHSLQVFDGLSGHGTVKLNIGFGTLS
jgi:hypothetical protein